VEWGSIGCVTFPCHTTGTVVWTLLSLTVAGAAPALSALFKEARRTGFPFHPRWGHLNAMR